MIVKGKALSFLIVFMFIASLLQIQILAAESSNGSIISQQYWSSNNKVPDLQETIIGRNWITDKNLPSESVGGDAAFNPSNGYNAKYRIVDFGKTVSYQEISKVITVVHAGQGTNIALSASIDGKKWTKIADVLVGKNLTLEERFLFTFINGNNFSGVNEFRYVKGEITKGEFSAVGACALDGLVVFSSGKTLFDKNLPHSTIIADDFENGTFSSKWIYYDHYGSYKYGDPKIRWKVISEGSNKVAYCNGTAFNCGVNTKSERVYIKSRFKVEKQQYSFPIGATVFSDINKINLQYYPLATTPNDQYFRTYDEHGTGFDYKLNGTFEPSKWYNLEYYFDGKQGLYQIFIDGKDITKGGKVASDSGKVARYQSSVGFINSVWFPGNENGLYVDYFEAYSYDQPQIEPSRQIGYMYEQTVDFAKDVKMPAINSVKAELIDESTNTYALTVEKYECDSKADPFFYWTTNDALFKQANSNFTQVTCTIDEKIKGRSIPVYVYLGDNLGYISKYTVWLKAK